MADTKISALTAATTLADADEFVIASSGATKKITTANLRASLDVPVLLEEIILGADAASIDFQNIPQGYAHLVIRALLRSTTVAVSVGSNIRLNNDPGSNYDRAQVRVTGGAASASVAAGETSGGGLLIPAASATADHFGYVVVEIPFYSIAAAQKIMHVRVGHVPNATTADFQAGISAINWRNTAAVTRVTLLAGADNYLAGSRARLYGSE